MKKNKLILLAMAFVLALTTMSFTMSAAQAVSFSKVKWVVWYQNDEGNSYPLQGATVEVLDLTANTHWSTATDANGVYWYFAKDGHQIYYVVSYYSNPQVCQAITNYRGGFWVWNPVEIHPTFHCHMSLGQTTR